VSATNGHGSAAAVVRELMGADRFIICTHEHPDGDALGSLVAMQHALTWLGKDAVSFMAAEEFPLPYEYRFLQLQRLVTEPPADLEERTIVFLDCGNIDRNPAEALKREGAHIINIDHHHDNTRFGTVDHVDPSASSTAQMVWSLLKPLGVPLTPPMAEALYVGLVTDTGKFMYENTTPEAHLMAAELLRAGVDAQGVYRRIFEGVPEGKIKLLARGLAKVQRFEGGRLTFTHLSREDYEESGAEEGYSEGVIDHLRAMQGTAVAVLVRELLGNGRDDMSKVSLRAADDRVDVSRIARAQGGGGHRRAAGFSTTMALADIVEFVRDEVQAQLAVAGPA
jgi:phosphoesterase RecJ-like protein